MIAAILVITILILLESYQEYIVNCARNSGNWDFKFYNIDYEKAKEIEKNKNIKEIGIIYKLGITDTVSTNPFGKTDMDLRAYDKKALEHEKFDVVEGRLPENSNEIIVQKQEGDSFKINEKLNLTINSKTKEYTIVGLAKKIDFNKTVIGNSRYAAVTYANEEIIKEDKKINITALTKNITNIYKTIEDIVKDNEDIKEKPKDNGESISKIIAGIIEEENEEIITFEYNENVLSYLGLSREDNEFSNRLNLIKLSSIIVIMIVSISVIQAAFKISYEERVKEYGMLSSIGMNKKQISKIMEIEALTLGTTGILLGLTIGIIVSKILIYFIDKLIRTTIYDVHPYKIINMDVELALKMPLTILLLVFLIIYIVVFISCELPIRKAKKISIIEAIKNNYKKIKNKNNRMPKIIEKIFKEEGVLAYKNTKRSKSKYRTVIISIVSSIVLFLTVNGLIANIFKNENEKEYNYEITLISTIENSEKNTEKLIKYLEDNNFVNSYSITKNEIFSNERNDSIVIKLETDRALELDKKIGKSGPVVGDNTYFTMNKYIEKIANESRQGVVEIFAYSFIILICIISALNIFTTISSSINLRKKDFAILKGIGMSGEQINKMLRVEGIFYCLNSIILGILISIVILYIMFTKMQDINLYKFEMPWLQIAISIIVTYIITFLAILTSKQQIKEQNIIKQIKEEEIIE